MIPKLLLETLLSTTLRRHHNYIAIYFVGKQDPFDHPALPLKFSMRVWFPKLSRSKYLINAEIPYRTGSTGKGRLTWLYNAQG